MILFCDQKCAIRILEDAKRLNMMDGHFVWLWVDTAEMTGQRINTTVTLDDTVPMKEESIREKRASITQKSIKRDISDIHRNYLLRNDQYLLFNDLEGNGDEGNRKARVVRDSSAGSPVFAKTSEASELPSGLLSLKPLPVRVDRHLVKGAARLLMATLKMVVEECPKCLFEDKLVNSCWTNNSEGTEFANFFAR